MVDPQKSGCWTLEKDSTRRPNNKLLIQKQQRMAFTDHVKPIDFADTLEEEFKIKIYEDVELVESTASSKNPRRSRKTTLPTLDRQIK